MRITLRFHGGAITGTGDDSVGIFTFSGSYGAGGEVEWVKRYFSHDVEYTGHWNGQMISGEWVIRSAFAENGQFEIWPEKEETHAETTEAEREAVGRAMGFIPSRR